MKERCCATVVSGGVWVLVTFGGGCLGIVEPATDSGAFEKLTPEEMENYAEKVYLEFAQSAGASLSFEIVGEPTRALAELSGRRMNSLVEVPDFWYEPQEIGTEIVRLLRSDRTQEIDEWTDGHTVDDFGAAGLDPVAGQYRTIAVSTRLEDKAWDHQAIEFCWIDAGVCTVADPVFLFLDSFVRNKRRLLAEGWAITEESVAHANDSKTQTRVCALASNRQKQRKITYNAYRIDYNNIFRKTLVHKDMGYQEVGISCIIDNQGDCRAAPWGVGVNSSCWSRLGWRCACDQAAGADITNRYDKVEAKSVAESKCAHRLVGHVEARVTYKGQGAGMYLDWDVSGSVDSIGGSLWDACGWINR